MKDLKAQFSPALEKAVIHALVVGGLPTSEVRPEELSKNGRLIHSAISKLLSDGGTAPFDSEKVFLVATELFGAETKIRTLLQ
jgi:hypothetical protein